MLYIPRGITTVTLTSTARDLDSIQLLFQLHKIYTPDFILQLKFNEHSCFSNCRKSWYPGEM